MATCSTNATVFDHKCVGFHGLDVHAQFVMAASGMRQSDEEVLEDSSIFDTIGEILHVIKSSYNMYISDNKQKGWLQSLCKPNTPSHWHIITLTEHVMEQNDALISCMHMKSLKKLLYGLH